MHFYSADITSSFLEKLRNPSQAPRDPSSLSVRIITVPLKPYESLRSRLLALLLPPKDHLTNPHPDQADGDAASRS
jgi:hypothetical protein